MSRWSLGQSVYSVLILIVTTFVAPSYLPFGVSRSAASPHTAGAVESDATLESKARATEERLRAPCCWTQTLDVHDSELSRELHREIVTRLRAGESSTQIEKVLVARFGERIRAVPHESPLSSVAFSVMAIIVLALAGLFVVARRWRDARELVPQEQEADSGLSSIYDERLAQELSKLD